VNALLAGLGALLPFLIAIGVPVFGALWFVRRRRPRPVPAPEQAAQPDA
jgi:hypothetical protein